MSDALPVTPVEKHVLVRCITDKRPVVDASVEPGISLALDDEAIIPLSQAEWLEKCRFVVIKGDA